MCTLEEMIACEVSFLPTGEKDYLRHIEAVLDLIERSGLTFTTGSFSTMVKGKKRLVFQLIEDIYNSMEMVCGFRLDVRFSNICGDR